MNCAGSVAENRSGGRSNIFADEGTAAHALLEMCLRVDQDPDKFIGSILYLDIITTEEMAEAVGHCLDFIRQYQKLNKKTELHIELEVDPFRYLGCEPKYTSGTLDVALDNAPVELVVIDYKHGAGVVVEVTDNTQLMLYLLAYVVQRAAQAYKKYRIVVVQPRSRHEDGPVRELEVTHEELKEFGQKVRARVREIQKNPTARTAGNWCRFCAAAGRCRTLKTYVSEVAQVDFSKAKSLPQNPEELTIKELEVIMAHLPALEVFCKKTYEHMHNYLMQGGRSKEWKLVAGRSTRFWGAPEKVITVLKRMGIKSTEYMSTPELLGVPKVEVVLKRKGKMIGKGKERRMPPLLMQQVQRSEPPIHIAERSDPRKEITRGSEFKEKRHGTKS